MEDKFDKFISEHRSEFDSETPSDRVLDNIHERLNKKRKGLSYGWIAAAALVGVLIGSFFFFQENEEVQMRVLNEDFAERSGPSFEEVEKYYLNEQTAIQSRLADFEIPQKQIINTEFNKQIIHLDQCYFELKEQLKQGYDQRIVDAMIKNLQMRMDLMNRQLRMLEHVKQLKNENHETTI